jgi:transcriptional regulator with XRE-family HTH domain
MVRWRAVPKKLREHRLAAGLSIEQLAEGAGIAADQVWRIEAGIYLKLHPGLMQRLATALDVAPEEVSEFRPFLRDDDDN